MAILIGNQPPTDVAEVWADAPPASAQAKPAPALITVETAAQAAFVTFLQGYHKALQESDAHFLTEHTSFPLPIAEIEYDMEVKSRHSKLPAVAKLVHARERLLWPAELVPKAAEELGKLRRGIEKCDDAKSPDKPNFALGDPAITLHDTSATLTYLAEPCAAETHMVTLTFVRAGKTWRLRERTVHKGAK